MGDKVRDGGRRCGQVRFRLTGPELLPWAKAPAVESFPAFPPDDHWPDSSGDLPLPRILPLTFMLR